ncbi:MAG: LysR family transcriptional regulator [Sulfitobacter sp.]
MLSGWAGGGKMGKMPVCDACTARAPPVHRRGHLPYWAQAGAEVRARRMKSGHIETIVAIADTGSLRAAAEKLGKTQPALSKALRLAEEDLGARLFVRAARGMEATKIGQTVIARARIIHAELGKLEEEVQQIKGAQTGSLNLTVSPLAAVKIIPSVMARFRQRFPKVHVQIAGGHPPATMASLRAGHTDIVIGPIPGKEDQAGISVRKLLDSPVCVITGKNSRHRGARHLAQLVEGEWVMIGPRQRVFGIGSDFRKLGLTAPVPVITSDSVSSLLAMIENSDLLCSFPSLLLDEMQQHWDILRLDLSGQIASVPIGVMTRSDRPLTPAGRSFAELVLAQAARGG